MGLAHPVTPIQTGFIEEEVMPQTNALSSRSFSARVSLATAITVLIVLVGAPAQADETSNRIAANRLTANRLSANRLAGNKLAASKLSENRLEANSVAAKMLSTADGREVYSYIISCALPEGKEIDATVSGAPDTAPPDTLYTCANGSCSFPGSIGLADYWIDHRLDVKGQRWVTACLLARVNYFGVKVIISLRGVAPQLLVGRHEAERYSLEEGAFYGNIFSDPDKPLDWNACRGKDAAAGETGDLKLRVCTEPDPNDPTRTKCGFNYAGDCGSSAGSATESKACNFFDSDGWYDGCLAGQAADEGPAAKPYSEVITTYVKQ
jgi:hypothetical protein